MKTRFTPHFAASLEEIILYWQNTLKLSPDRIEKFTSHIAAKIDLLTLYPRMGQDVTQQYNFNRPTYRLLIGHSYGIFYRLDADNDLIIVGAIYSNVQVKVKF